MVPLAFSTSALAALCPLHAKRTLLAFGAAHTALGRGAQIRSGWVDLNVKRNKAFELVSSLDSIRARLTTDHRWAGISKQTRRSGLLLPRIIATDGLRIQSEAIARVDTRTDRDGMHRQDAQELTNAQTEAQTEARGRPRRSQKRRPR